MKTLISLFLLILLSSCLAQDPATRYAKEHRHREYNYKYLQGGWGKWNSEHEKNQKKPVKGPIK